MRRDKDVVVVAKDMEGLRSIHRQDMYSLVCDMLNLVDMGRTWDLHCMCIERRWMCAEIPWEHRPG